jgi:hypothetical protein
VIANSAAGDRQAAVAHITNGRDHTYANSAGLAPGLYEDRGALAGHVLVGANCRRLLVADVAGSLWIGGAEVCDPAVLLSLAETLTQHAGRMIARSQR